MGDDRAEAERRGLQQLLREFQIGDEDRFTHDERRRVRDFLRLIETEDAQRRFHDLMAIVPDLKTIVEGKRVSAGVYKAVGEFAKWAGGIIAAIVAYKALISGGGK